MLFRTKKFRKKSLPEFFLLLFLSAAVFGFSLCGVLFAEGAFVADFIHTAFVACAVGTVVCFAGGIAAISSAVIFRIGLSCIIFRHSLFSPFKNIFQKGFCLPKIFSADYFELFSRKIIV